MKTLSLILFCVLITNQGQAQSEDSLKTYLNVRVPQSSGIAFTNYRHYRVENDSLYVLYSQWDSTEEELLNKYPVDKNDLIELDSLLSQVDLIQMDSLFPHSYKFGYHTSGFFISGRVRFFIAASYQGKRFNGYVANCYREHIFVFLDWLNKVYPEKDVMSYNKHELIKLEEKNKLEEEESEKG